MPGIEWIASFNYDPFVRGANAVKQSVERMFSLIQKAGNSLDDVIHRITDGGNAEKFERKAQQIAKVYGSIVTNIGLTGEAAQKAKGRIDKALDDMANSADRPKARFRKFADEMTAILSEIRATEAPVGTTSNTSAIASVERRLKLESDIVDVLERQKALAEQARTQNAEGYSRRKASLTELEDRLSFKYDGAPEMFYSQEDVDKLNAARESVEKWAKAWDDCNTGVQTCDALIDEATQRTEKAKQKVEELNNVYKGFANTAESTSTKIFISEDVFNRYQELLGTIATLKERIKEAGSQDDIDLPKLQGMQEQLAYAQDEFRSLDGTARHTAEVLGAELAEKVSKVLEKLYNLNAMVRNSSGEVADLGQRLKEAKRELTEAKDPAAITLARQKVDELSVALDKARDDLSKYKAEQKDVVADIQRMSQNVGNGGGNGTGIADEVGQQVKNIMGNIAAIAGIGLGLSEVKDFFNQSKEWRMYFQDIESSFKVFLGSAEKGAEFTEKLQKYAYYNMFEFSDLAAASQQMISYGHNVESIIPRLDQLSNVATGTHGSLMELVDAYNRAKATGVVDARGVQSWATKGVMIRDVLRDLGETTAGTTITFEQLNRVLDHVTGEGGQFHNLMGEMMSNVSAEAGQLEDNLSLMFNEVGMQYEEVFVKFLKLQGEMVDNYRDIGGGVLDFGADAATFALDKLAENWRTIVDIIKGAIVAYGAFKAAMLVHSAAVAANTTVTKLATIAQEMNAGASYQQAAAIAKATIQGDLETASEIRATVALNANTAAKGANTAATVTLGNAIKGLTATMLANPLVLAATAIAGIAYACYSAYEGIMTQEKGQRLLNDATDAFNERMEEEKQHANDDIRVIQDKTASLMQQTKAYRDLIAEHEIFSKFSKEEIANMSSDEINSQLEEEKARKNEERIRNQVEAAKELQQLFAGSGAAWTKGMFWTEGENDVIDKVVEKFKLLPEYAEQLKNSIGGMTNLSAWANQLVNSSNDELQKYLTKEAEAGVVEGIKKGIASDSLKSDVTRLLSDYGKQIGGETAEQEKALAEARARLARIESREEIFEKDYNGAKRLTALRETQELIDSISKSIVKARGEIGKTFGDTFTEKAKEAKDKVEELEHSVAAATGTKKTELQVQLKQARYEYDTLQSILKLVEAGSVDAEVVMKVTREADNAILGDEKLVEIGKGYEQIDELGQKFTNLWATAKEEMDAVGEGSEKTAEDITAAWEKSSEEVFTSLGKTEEELSKNITDLESEQDGLKEKFGETYKDTEEYRKLEVEITRKKEQLTYLQDLKKDLKAIAKEPFSIWIDIKTKISDKVKGLLKNFLSDEQYKKLFGDEETKKSVSQTAQGEGKDAQSRIDEKKDTTTRKTGAQWKSEETKQLRADLKKINDELKQPIDKTRYDELMRQKSQIESALKKGDAAAKKLMDRRAKQLQEQWKHEEAMSDLEEKAQRARTAASIAGIQNQSVRERAEREAQYRQSLEDLKNKEDEIYKTIYNQRKQAYETANKDKKYENTKEGMAGYTDTDARLKMEASLTAEERRQFDLNQQYYKSERLKTEAEFARYTVERYKNEAQALRDYMKEYGSSEQQRLAIAQDYAQKIAEAEAGGDNIEAARLRAEQQSKEAEMELKQIKESINWESVFNDLDRLSTEALKELKEKLRKALDVKDISPENAKVLSEKILEIENRISDKTNIWSSMIPALKERQRLVNEVKVAEEDIARAQDKVGRALMTSTSANMGLQGMARKMLGRALTKEELGASSGTEFIDRINASIAESNKAVGDSAKKMLLTGKAADELKASFEKNVESTSSLKKAQEELTEAQRQGKYANDMLKSLTGGGAKGQDFGGAMKAIFSNAIDGQGGGFMGILGLVQDNLNSMAEFTDKIGLEGTAFGDAVHGFAEGVNGFMSAIKSLANGDIFGAINGVIDGFTGFFYNGFKNLGQALGIIGGRDNHEEMLKRQKEYTRSIESTTRALDKMTTELERSYGVSAMENAARAKDIIERNMGSIVNGIGSVLEDNYGGGHSDYYHFNKQQDVLQGILGFGKDNGIDVSSIGSWQDLLSMNTPESLAKTFKAISESGEDLWRRIVTMGYNEGALEEWIGKLIDAYEQLDDNTLKLREQLTTTTADNVFNDFLGSLHDLADGSEDVMDDIAGSWQQMVNRMVVNNLFGKRINEFVYGADGVTGWYERLAEIQQQFSGRYGEQGYLDAIERLREEYSDEIKAINAEMEGLRDSGIIRPLDDVAKESKKYFENLRDSWASTLTDMSADAESWKNELLSTILSDLVESTILNVPVTLTTTETAKGEQTFRDFETYLKDWSGRYKAVIEDATLTDEERNERLLALVQEQADLREEMAEKSRALAEGIGKDMAETFSNSLDNLGDTLLDAFLDTEKDAEEAASGMGKEIASTLMKEMLQELLAQDKYADRINAIREKWQQVLKGENVDETGAVLFTIDDVLQDIADLNTDMGKDESITSLAEKWKEVEREMKDTDSAFGNLRSSFLDTLTDMEGDATTFRKKLEETLIKDLIERRVLDVPITVNGGDFKDFDAYVSDWNKRYTQAVKDGNDEAINKLLDELAEVREMTLKSAEEYRLHLKSLLDEDDTFKGMSDAWVSTLMDMSKDADDWAKNIGGVMAERIIKQMIVPTMIQPLLDQLQGVFNDVMNASTSPNGNGGWVYDWESVMNNDGLSAAIDALKEQYPDIQAAIRQIMEAFDAVDYGNPLSGVIGSFASSLLDLEEDAGSFGRDIAHILTEQMLEEFVSDKYKKDIEDLNRKWSEVLTFGDAESIEKVRREVMEFYSTISNDNGVQGLIKDIKALEQESDTTFKGMSDAWASALMDMEGTSREWGKEIGRTLADRIVREMIVGKQLQPYLDAIQESFNAAFTEEGASVGDVLSAVLPSIEAAEEAFASMKPAVDGLMRSLGLMSTPFDDLRSSMLSAFMDAENDTEDFVADINKTLARIAIDKYVLSGIDGQLEAWKKQYEAIMSDETLSPEERAKAEKSISDAIGAWKDEAASEAEKWKSLFGVDGPDDQQASMNMADKITYDQADMLLGINMAQEMSLEQGNAVSRQILATLQSMGGITSSGEDPMLEISNKLNITNDYLRAIRDEVRAHMGNIERNTSHMTRL